MSVALHKGQAKMTATMVGMDWGMAALGINSTPRQPRETVVRPERLTKRYGEHAAVSNVSFEVRWGDVFDFLEPNEPGKSTTIGMMLGLIHRSTGPIELFGLSTGDRADGLARRDNLRALAQLRPGARIGQMLATVGLNDAAGERSVRPGIIHAVHGVTPDGSWFLLAAIAPNRSSNDSRPCTAETTTSDPWLVVLGHHDRDIISPHGQDA